MKIIPKECIAAVKAAAPILRHVEACTQLRLDGDEYIGRSPLVDHDAKESLSINPATGRFKCAASGKYGDVIDFEMALSGARFTDAVQFLARSNGVPLEFETGTSRHRRKKSPGGETAA